MVCSLDINVTAPPSSRQRGVVISAVGAVSSLSTLAEYLPFLNNIGTAAYALIQGLLPVIAMSILLALVPIIITKLSLAVERRKSLTQVQLMLFGWYFLYSLANVFLVVVSGSIFSSLSKAIKDPTSIVDLLGTALPSVSTFFINFVITQLLSGVPMAMLRLGPLIMLYLTKKFNGKSVTERVLFSGPLAPATIEYGAFFPAILYIVALFTVYWTIAPILAFVCFLYFLATYIVYVYQFLFVIVPQVRTHAGARVGCSLDIVGHKTPTRSQKSA